jgi:hypothetical protein
LENIRARAHFLILLTPTALERSSDPEDWMRREIEAALDSQRNIVPLMLEGFDFGTPAIATQVTGKLAALKQYNGLPIPKGYFAPAMERLRNKFLSVSLDTVLHQASDSAQQVATEQKDKATMALGEALRQPLLSPEERRKQEETAAQHRAEEERRRQEAQAKRQAVAETQRAKEERRSRVMEGQQRSVQDETSNVGLGSIERDASARTRTGIQALLLIHGMGEQRTMDTIKAFVRAVWQTDDVITATNLPRPTQVWSKADLRAGSLELRRITTRESIPSASFPHGVRTDFYELYWADLTAGSTWDQFTGWVGGLLFRPLSRVPPDLRLAWLALWIATLAVIALAVLAALPADVWRKTGADWLADWHWLLAVVAASFGTLLHKIATATFGRVVRYTKADPDNVAARQAVRERGIRLLNSLHEGNEYERIIIVSHSLGTIVAHDLLSYFWEQHEAPRRIAESSPEFDALCELERAAEAVDLNPTAAVLGQYYEAQRRLRIALAARPAPPPTMPDSRWLITDFVTLGSPLAHAEFLIAASAEDLARRKFERQLPLSPPLREDLDPNVFRLAQATHKLPVGPNFNTSKLISFPVPSSPKVWVLHSAAPFAVVRWTNIYDPARLVFSGDIIGGPLARTFGPAIIDSCAAKQTASLTPDTGNLTANRNTLKLSAARSIYLKDTRIKAISAPFSIAQQRAAMKLMAFDVAW